MVQDELWKLFFFKLFLIIRDVLADKLRKTKSAMLCQPNPSISRISIMELASGISKPSFPLIDLVVLIVNVSKTSYFNSLIEKVQKTLFNWSSCFLYAGSKLILIKHVL